MNSKDKLSKGLTTDQKLKIIGNCEEIHTATKILIATMKDCGIPNHITIAFELMNERYELKLTKL